MLPRKPTPFLSFKIPFSQIGPLWHPPIQVEHVLNPNDAVFVDITHTNQGALGTLQESGHVDFYRMLT